MNEVEPGLLAGVKKERVGACQRSSIQTKRPSSWQHGKGIRKHGMQSFHKDSFSTTNLTAFFAAGRGWVVREGEGVGFRIGLGIGFGFNGCGRRRGGGTGTLRRTRWRHGV